MLQPKRVKYRRPFRIKHEGIARKGKTIAFGDYGLQAITSGWISNRQIESARIAIARHMNREGQVWIRIFPHMAKTSKPIGIRMGSGKGNPDQWIAVVKEQKIMFEISGVPRDRALKALKLGMYKLPIKSKVIEREDK